MVYFFSREDSVMSEAKPSHPDKERFWRRMLKRQPRSKLSTRAFCHQPGQHWSGLPPIQHELAFVGPAGFRLAIPILAHASG
jgi:hypothetical protein